MWPVCIHWICKCVDPKLIVIHCPWDKWAWCRLCVHSLHLDWEEEEERARTRLARCLHRFGFSRIASKQLWVESEEKVRGKAALVSLMSNLIPHGGKHWAVNLAAIRLAAEVTGGGDFSARAAAVREEPVSVSAACRRVKCKRWILFLKRVPHMSSILSHYTNSFIKPLNAN